MSIELQQLYEKYQSEVAFLDRKILSVNAKGAMGETLLNLAVIAQDIADIKLLIANEVDLNARGEMGFTALHNACMKGNATIIELLLENGANPTAKNDFGYTPMHYINAVEGNKKVKKLLSLFK